MATPWWSISVGPDTPAARAGIMAGDIIHRIDNRPVASIETPLDGVDLRGPVDSTVVLTVLQVGAEGTINVTIVREAIIVHPVTYQMIDNTPYLWIQDRPVRRPHHAGTRRGDRLGSVAGSRRASCSTCAGMEGDGSSPPRKPSAAFSTMT